ncbi:MAG: RloB family protein [Treponema sp.]|nr:RloB family protein [Treponema sp.]
MAQHKNSRPARKMKPVILVLCEGETEALYVEHLKQKYRLPIKIVSKVVGQQVNQKLINRYKKELKITSTENIACFLMYDADVQNVVENIKNCDADALLSRPCIEVWFLAHEEKIPATDISGDECLARLKKHDDWKNYRKANLTDKEKEVLWEKRLSAHENISSAEATDSAFSSVSRFIGFLENRRLQ